MNQQTFSLSSPAFDEGQRIPDVHTCLGENTSPPLLIEGTPPGTACLVVIAHDPDALAGDFVHCLLWNIPPHIRELSLSTPPPPAVAGTNGFDTVGYSGPCPPRGNGDHRYIFELYALGETLDLTPGSSHAALIHAMEDKIVAQASMTGTYSIPAA